MTDNSGLTNSGSANSIRVQPGTGALYIQSDSSGSTQQTYNPVAGISATGSSVITFRSLPDIMSYTGNAGKVLAINQSENGVIWKNPIPDFSFTFPIYFNSLGSDNPSMVQAEMPNGWRADVTGSIVTIYHTVGRMPTFMTFMGKQNDNSWSFRLPTSLNNLVIPPGMTFYAFQFTASPTICGTGDPQTQARVTVYF